MNAQRKSHWRFLRVIMRNILPFKKALYLTKIDRKVEGDTLTRQNQVIKTKIKIFFFEITRVQVLESSTMQVQNQMVNTSFIIQKEVPVTSNSKLVPLIKIADLEHVHQVIRKFFTKSIPNKPLAGRLASFIATWEKITQDQEILSIVKGCKIPFVSLPFQEKITELDKNVKRTIFISGTGSFRNIAERSYPKRSTQTRAISEEPLPCRKKGWREPPNDKF